LALTLLHGNELWLSWSKWPAGEDLGAMAVKFAPEELREFNAAASKIVVHGERLRKELLVMWRVEAPLIKQRH
jgi:hypothetical protein